MVFFLKTFTVAIVTKKEDQYVLKIEKYRFGPNLRLWELNIFRIRYQRS